MARLPRFRSSSKSAELLQFARGLVDAQLRGARASRNTRYLTGNLGLRVVGSVVSGGSAVQELATVYKQLVKAGERSMPEENEVLNGKAGMLFGADTVR